MPIECPICKSTRTWKQRKLFRGKWFGCYSCGWEIPQSEFHEKGGVHGIKARNTKRVSSGWEKIDRLPSWAIKKIKKTKRNRVDGKTYAYKKEGSNFYKKLR